MKQIIANSQVLFFVLMVLVLSCKKTELPQVLTLEVIEVTKTTAIVSGKIAYDGGDIISEYGICFSTANNPTIADNKVISKNNQSDFSCELQMLLPCTQYYARAYAVNKEGVAYGKAIPLLTDFETITDIEGNVYKIVQIGSQVWMAENLRTTTLSNGTSIPYVPNSEDWQNCYYSKAYCWYNNDFESYGTTYGALYNYNVISTNKLCPQGWHIPNDDEWLTMINYLGGTSVAGGKLKETGITHWESPNTGATNSVMFNGLPGGCRVYYGTYLSSKQIGYWWSASNFNQVTVNFWSVYFDRSLIAGNLTSSRTGYSVRCVKN